MPSNFRSISKFFGRKAQKKVDNEPKAVVAVRSCSGHRSQRSEERGQLELVADGWHGPSILDVQRHPSYISSRTSPHSTYSSTVTLVPDTPPPSVHSFDFLKYVDKGSFDSIYYKVRRVETREIYALKVIQKEGCSEKHIAELIQEQALLRFVVECELGSRYTQLVARWSDTKFLYLLMPLYPTTIWDEVIRCNRLTAEPVRFHMAELILAIKDLHAQGTIHRDVKAPNILISRTGHPVLADFGLAHKFPRCPTMEERETQPYYSSHKDNIDCSHLKELAHLLFESCGSPDEMAPELFLGKPYSYSVDFWSLAVTMYFMLSGQYPWEDDDLHSLGKKIIKEPLRFDEALEMDADCRYFLQRMLEKQPQDRLPTCEIESHPYFR